MACPICTRDTHAEYRPFCSKRCADVDLAKWLTGSYAIPVAPGDDADPEDGSWEDGNIPDGEIGPKH